MKYILTHEELAISNKLDDAINEGFIDSINKAINFFKGGTTLWNEIKKTAKVKNTEIFDEIKKFDTDKLDGFYFFRKLNYSDVKKYLTAVVNYADTKYEYTKEYYGQGAHMKNAFKEGSFELKVYDDAVKSKLDVFKKQMNKVLTDGDTAENYKNSIFDYTEILLADKAIEMAKSSKDDLDFSEYEKSRDEKKKEIEGLNKTAESNAKKEEKKEQEQQEKLTKSVGIDVTDKEVDAETAINNLDKNTENSKKEGFDKYIDADKDNYYSFENIEDKYSDATEYIEDAVTVTNDVLKDHFNEYKNEYKDNFVVQQLITNILLQLILTSLSSKSISKELIASSAALMTTDFGVGFNCPTIKEAGNKLTTFTKIIQDLPKNKIIKNDLDNKKLKQFNTNFGKIANALISKTKEMNKNNQPEI